MTSSRVPANTLEMDVADPPATVTITVMRTGGGPDDPDQVAACNLAGAHTITLLVASDDETVATVAPGSLVFDDCDEGQTIAVTPVAVRTANISVNLDASSPIPPGTFRYLANFVVIVGDAGGGDDTCDQETGEGCVEVCEEPAAPASAAHILVCRGGGRLPRGSDGPGPSGHPRPWAGG